MNMNSQHRSQHEEEEEQNQIIPTERQNSCVEIHQIQNQLPVNLAEPLQAQNIVPAQQSKKSLRISIVKYVVVPVFVGVFVGLVILLLAKVI
ncbi:hypothetical protein pb186bvf_021164 [Paramecium bursaria]